MNEQNVCHQVSLREKSEGFKGKKRLELGLEQNHSKPDGQQGTKLEGIPSLKNYVRKGRQKQKTAKSAWKQAAVCQSTRRDYRPGPLSSSTHSRAGAVLCPRHKRFSPLRCCGGSTVCPQVIPPFKRWDLAPFPLNQRSKKCMMSEIGTQRDCGFLLALSVGSPTP